MTKIAGSGSISQRHGSARIRTKCHGSGTVVFTFKDRTFEHMLLPYLFYLKYAFTIALRFTVQYVCMYVCTALDFYKFNLLWVSRNHLSEGGEEGQRIHTNNYTH
jgi:hypothetical protein